MIASLESYGWKEALQRQYAHLSTLHKQQLPLCGGTNIPHSIFCVTDWEEVGIGPKKQPFLHFAYITITEVIILSSTVRNDKH